MSEDKRGNDNWAEMILKPVGFIRSSIAEPSLVARAGDLDCDSPIEDLSLIHI